MSTSTGQAASLDDFGDKPLFVRTAGVGSDATWMAAQDELATLSTNTVHRVIDGAKHAALIHEEEFAAASQVILDVISSVRSGTPLNGW